MMNLLKLLHSAEETHSAAREGGGATGNPRKEEVTNIALPLSPHAVSQEVNVEERMNETDESLNFLRFLRRDEREGSR